MHLRFLLLIEVFQIFFRLCGKQMYRLWWKGKTDFLVFRSSLNGLADFQGLDNGDALTRRQHMQIDGASHQLCHLMDAVQPSARRTELNILWAHAQHNRLFLDLACPEVVLLLLRQCNSMPLQFYQVLFALPQKLCIKEVHLGRANKTTHE